MAGEERVKGGKVGDADNFAEADDGAGTGESEALADKGEGKEGKGERKGGYKPCRFSGIPIPSAHPCPARRLGRPSPPPSVLPSVPPSARVFFRPSVSAIHHRQLVGIE